MIIQRVSPGVCRLRRRGAVLVAGALLLLLSGTSTSHADDGGLHGDVTQIVEAAADETVEPVAQTAQTAVPQPVQEAVEPVAQTAHSAVPQPVKQAVEPAAEPAVEQAVPQPVKQAVEPAVEQAAEPGRIVEPSAQPAVRPEPQVVDPMTESNPDSVAPQVPIGGSSNNSPSAVVSGPEAAKQVNAGATGRADQQRHSMIAGRSSRSDLAPRATAGPEILGSSDAGNDPGADPNADPGGSKVAEITNALMHLYAGLDVPGGINAGLAGVVASARTSWTAPVLLMLLGFLLLNLARRRLR